MPAKFPLWDIPTRLFHWTIVCCVVLAWWSAENERYELHEWTGFTVIALVVTRIAWGIFGSPHSRFTDFLVGPRDVLGYIRGAPPASAGHNPLGGWSVVAILLLLLAQGISGLFNSDDVLFSGPLYYAASTGFRDAMGVVHEIAFDTLVVLICLHIAAVVYYQWRRREKLVQAMVRGSAPGKEGRAAPVNPWLALATLGLVALALWWGLEQAPEPQLMW